MLLLRFFTLGNVKTSNIISPKGAIGFKHVHRESGSGQILDLLSFAYGSSKSVGVLEISRKGTVVAPISSGGSFS